MFGQNQGALGTTFILTRGAQAVSMVAIIGMTANFVSEMVAANVAPPSVLIGVLSIVCTPVLYCAITVILHLDNLLPFLVNSVIDSLFLITLIVVSVVVGKPLSYINCNAIGTLNSDASSALSFTSALGNSLAHNNGKIEYDEWIGTNKATCFEMKSIWGLSIALCIMFFLSSVSTLCLWKRGKSITPTKGEA